MLFIHTYYSQYSSPESMSPVAVLIGFSYTWPSATKAAHDYVAVWAGLAWWKPVRHRAVFTIPEHPLILCETGATRLNGWSRVIIVFTLLESRCVFIWWMLIMNSTTRLIRLDRLPYWCSNFDQKSPQIIGLARIQVTTVVIIDSVLLTPRHAYIVFSW